MPGAAAQLGKLAAGIKDFKGTWVARAFALFTVVTGTLELVDAIRRGDDVGAIRASGTILSAMVGVGAQMMKMGGPYGAILTIYVQQVVEAVIAIGRMGAALRQASTNHTIAHVAGIAGKGTQLAKAATALATAWKGQITAENGNDDPSRTLAAAYAAEVERETQHVRVIATQIVTEIRAMRSSGIRNGDMLVAAVGSNAIDAMSGIARVIDPFTLVATCRDVILPGLQHLTQAALQAGTMSPDRLMNGGLEEIAGK